MRLKQFNLSLISADGIRNVNFFTKMSVYAVAFITMSDTMLRSHKTNTDSRGGTNPNWGNRMLFVVNEDAAEANNHDFYVQLVCRRRLLPDKIIGAVHYPIKELLELHEGEDCSLLATTAVVDAKSGKDQGKLTFSFSFGETMHRTSPS